MCFFFNSFNPSYSSRPRTIMFGKKSLSVIHRVVSQGVRFESSVSVSPRAPFASGRNNDSNKPVSFDKNMPSFAPKKAWERDGQDKEKWFKRKHAHHHVLQKPNREIMERRYEGIQRKKMRERRDTFEERDQIREYREGLKRKRSNTQIDYIFGTNPVLAVLKGDKRSKFGKLYIYNPKDTDKVNEIVALAKEKNIPIRESSKQDLNILTDNSVHNGIVLETRPMEIASIRSMGPNTTMDSYNIKEVQDILGGEFEENDKFVDSYGARYPLGLYLDEISDPHNVGAILRSAYFLGVDFIVFSEKNCAPLSPVVAKTSSGAIEFTELFKVDKPLTFFDESKKNGWTFISTIAPTNKKNSSKQVDTQFINDLLQTQPVILVVGSEGSGIRTNLLNRSDFLVAVGNGREINECVDSLNVSVATALLISKILT